MEGVFQLDLIQVCEICQQAWVILPTKKQLKLLQKHGAETLMEVVICEECEKKENRYV